MRKCATTAEPGPDEVVRQYKQTFHCRLQRKAGHPPSRDSVYASVSEKWAFTQRQALMAGVPQMLMGLSGHESYENHLPTC
mmetsp:Transcript_24498/g.38784  ORF Transcript_24498/g.38784 Transcript_24498/m.38784 type:complete len:81 (+) Transcript_24498:3-245(+)